MDAQALIPTPDTIPAPWGLFEFLDIFTLIIHLLFMNVVVGGCIITFFSRLKASDQPLSESLHGSFVKKIPSLLALTITFGVAPLLFIQVLYGHFIYSSSILMAVYWLLVIPLLIIAYYGIYIHAGKYVTSRWLSIAALGISSVILIYIMITYVNNMTLMLQPEKWRAYFSNRGGTLLNLGDPTFFPRFLHFLTAAIAVAGLFGAITWYTRQKKGITEAGQAEEKIKTGLKIFGIATAVQVVIGIWFLIALPREIMLGFMGGNILYTIVLLLGIAAGIAVLVTAFLGKLVPTAALLLVTVVFMVINRANLRSLYLEKYFDPASLELSPQYPVMALFFVVFIIGLIVVAYMLKTAFAAKTTKGGAQ
ncbi:MAG: hypothetical protein JSV88_04305 [Candidatus Aminicenantes bacterium]|nr:MAG: hypothetical protein JSV88_04305 [Candidatus Aminicenantes bacterium]